VGVSVHALKGKEVQRSGSDKHLLPKVFEASLEGSNFFSKFERKKKIQEMNSTSVGVLS